MERNPLVEQIQQETDVLRGEATKDRTYTSERTFATEQLAQKAFARAVARLNNIDAWSDLSIITANFTHYDAVGRSAAGGPVQLGDFIRIALPEPMPENWVRVIDTHADETTFSFTVQPCADPLGDDPNQTTHFFSHEARSTFRITIAGTTVSAAEIGEHEGINNQQPEAGDRALINTFIAEAGWLFYQKLQWKHLTDYLVSE